MKSHFIQNHQSKGFALLAVLWLIAILSFAAMTTLRVISFDMNIAAANIHGSRAYQLAEMGIALGVNPMVTPDDPLLHKLDEANNEELQVTIRSEGARFNINHLLQSEDKDLLRSIFIHWGLDLDSAQALTDAFLDWVDADSETALNGAEKKDYEKMGRTNQPFNRPFHLVEEMSLVSGMEEIEKLRPDWADWFTVYSSGPLDLNEAEAELIAIAADVSPERAAIIPSTVRGADGILHTEDDKRYEEVGTAISLLGIGGEASQLVAKRFSHMDSTLRITSIGRAGDAKRKISVIVRNREGNPSLLDRKMEIVP